MTYSVSRTPFFRRIFGCDLPAAVSAWASQKDPQAVNQIHFNLLTTYRDDFAKYSGRLTIERLEEIMRSVPRQLEVKAGSTGTLKSLQQFILEKKKAVAVRVNSDFPSLCCVNIKNSTGISIEYSLLSIPFYLIGQLHRLIKNAKK